MSTDAENALEQRRQQQQSLLDWLNPFNWSWTSLLVLGGLGVGGYAVGRGQNPDNWLSGLVSAFLSILPQSWQEGIAGWFMPQSVSDAFKEEPGALTRVMGYIREQHGDFLNPINDKLVFTMVTKEWPVVERLLKGAKDTKNADPETTKKLMAALRGIAGNPTMMATLMSPEHRAHIFKALEMLSPIPFAPGKLGAFIESVGMTDGKPNAFLSSLITKLLADDDATRNAGLSDLLKTANPQALAGLFAGIDPASITDPTLRQWLPLGSNPQAVGALQGIEQNLGSKGSSLSALGDQIQNPDQLVAFMLNKDNRDLVRENAGRLGILAEQAAKTTTDPQLQAALGFLGTRVNVNGVDKARNVTAIIGFFDNVGRNDYNKQDSARTFNVITGLMGMLTGTEAAGRLTSDNLSQFFHDPGNVAAFGQFLGSIDTRNLPAAQQQLIVTLKQHWGNGDDGVAEVLGDKASLEWLFKQMTDPPKPGVVSQVVGLLPNSVQYWLGATLPSGMTGLPGKVGENSAHLGALREVLASISGGEHAAAPAGAPPAPAAPSAAVGAR